MKKQSQVKNEFTSPRVQRFSSPFIDQELYLAVAEKTEKIREKLSDLSGGERNVASLLVALKTHFESFAITREVDKAIANTAFHEYVKVLFGIEKNRADEYIQVALHQVAQDLKLPISKLVEISRLPLNVAERFVEAFPEKELQSFSFRQLKKLVKKHNPNARIKVRAPTSKKVSQSLPTTVEEAAQVSNVIELPKKMSSGVPQTSRMNVDGLDIEIQNWKAMANRQGELKKK